MRACVMAAASSLMRARCQARARALLSCAAVAAASQAVRSCVHSELSRCRDHAPGCCSPQQLTFVIASPGSWRCQMACRVARALMLPCSATCAAAAGRESGTRNARTRPPAAATGQRRVHQSAGSAAGVTLRHDAEAATVCWMIRLRHTGTLGAAAGGSWHRLQLGSVRTQQLSAQLNPAQQVC